MSRNGSSVAWMLCGILLPVVQGGLFAANPPALTHYQGVLRGAADEPLTGAYDMDFRFFDLESGSTCVPDAADEIRRFDGYHDEGELGLPAEADALWECVSELVARRCRHWSDLTPRELEAVVTALRERVAAGAPA